MNKLFLLLLIALGLTSCSKKQVDSPISNTEPDRHSALYGDYKFSVHYEYFQMAYDSKVEDSKLIRKDYVTYGNVIKSSMENEFIIYWGNDTVGKTAVVYSPSRIKWVEGSYESKYFSPNNLGQYFNADSLQFVLNNFAAYESWVIKGIKIK